MRFRKREGSRHWRVLLIGTNLALCAACGGNGAAKAPASATPKSTGTDSGAATGQKATAPASIPRVVIMGTSLTAGLGLDPSDAYPALLQKLADSLNYKVNIVNAGLSGEMLAGALRRANWVLEQPVAAVVLEVGANDGLRGVNTDSTQASIESLIDIIRKKQPTATVLLVQMEAPPNFGRDYITRFHSLYKAAADDKHVTLLPFLLDSVAGVQQLNQGDGIHPNKIGAHIVARNMLRALTPLFKSLTPTSN